MGNDSLNTIVWLDDSIPYTGWKGELEKENVQMWVTTSPVVQIPAKYNLVRLKGFKDFHHRTRIMQQVDLWLNDSKDQHLNKWIEIIRYDLFYDFVKWELPYFYLDQWLQEFGSIRILWLSSVGNSEELIRLAEACSFFPAVHLELLSSNGLGRKSKYATLRHRIANRLSSSFEIFVNSLSSPARLLPGKILALEYYTNNFHTLLDVEKAWNEVGGDTFNWVAMRPAVQAEIHKNNKGDSMIWNWLSPFDAIKLLINSSVSEFKSLIEVIRQNENTPDYWKMGPLTKRFKSEFLINFRLAKNYYNCLYTLLRQVNPAVVIGTVYSNIPGRALGFISAESGIKSIYFQHGVIQPFLVNTYILHNYLVLWGQRDAELFAKRGVSRDRIVISGPLSYNKELEAKPFKSFNKIPLSNFNVAYMASRTDGMWVNSSVARDTLQLLIGALDYCPGMKLTIKKHPGDNTHLIEAMVQTQNSDKIELFNKHSKEVISSADVVVVVSSSTGIEACIMGKPVINLNITGNKDISSLAQLNAAYEITESSSFKEHWLQFIESEELQLELYKNKLQVLDALVNAGGPSPSKVIVKLLSELN